MILRYTRNVLRFKKWKLVCLVIALLLGLRLAAALLTFRARVDQLFELHKCPACFGLGACEFARKVDLTFVGLSDALLYFFGAKNVFFGKIDNQRVVLKKLAHYSELDEFDERLQEKSNYSHFFAKGERKQDVDFEKLIGREVSLSFDEDHLSRMRLCPTVEDLNKLLKNVYANNKDSDRSVLLANIWSLVSINPEPLLLQILSSDYGWPVPKYFGACGRVVIEEYLGQPLYTYHNSPWPLRAKIASNLLDAARKFTFEDKDFAFYLTDISADNIAISPSHHAKFVDLENVIVVSRNVSSTMKPPTWDEFHENTEDFDYPDQLIFSAKDICAHRLSDHNFYAICQMLLSAKARDSSLPGGLLHSVPANITQTFPMLQYYINQCTKPVGPYNRIEAGVKLKDLLDNILQSMKKHDD